MLAGELAQTEQRLQTADQELADVREKRSVDLAHLTAVDFHTQQLGAEVAEKDSVIAQQQKFLAADRDIRELMGARQLYIADVVDVDREGNNRHPFGRVFYTKGRSLVFYGFDLDQQPGILNSSVFQVWGQRDGAGSRRPIDLGVFYLDNENNRRWDPAARLRRR